MDGRNLITSKRLKGAMSPLMLKNLNKIIKSEKLKTEIIDNLILFYFDGCTEILENESLRNEMLYHAVTLRDPFAPNYKPRKELAKISGNILLDFCKNAIILKNKCQN